MYVREAGLAKPWEAGKMTGTSRFGNLSESEAHSAVQLVSTVVHGGKNTWSTKGESELPAMRPLLNMQSLHDVTAGKERGHQVPSI